MSNDIQVPEKIVSVSVIIPTWNRSNNVIKTLACLEDQEIDPSFHMEVVVVDDSSTDGTSNAILAKKFKLDLKLLYYNDRKGWNASIPRNRGARVAESPHFIFLDSDVLLPPNRIQRFIDVWNEDPDPNRVLLGPYHNMSRPLDLTSNWWNQAITGYVADVRWNSFREHPAQEKNQGFGFALACFGGSMMLTRRLFFKAGGYDETMVNGGEDGDFGLTLWETGALVSMDEGLLGWHQSHEIDAVRRTTPWETIKRIDAKHHVDVIKETGQNFRQWGINWKRPDPLEELKEKEAHDAQEAQPGIGEQSQA